MTTEQIDKLVAFYLKYSGRKEEPKEIRNSIEQHLTNASIDYATDESGEVIGVCIWDVPNNGKIAHIYDLHIREDWRNKELGKHFLRRGLKMWKNVTHLEFKRGKRNEKKRLIPIEYFLNNKYF